jgi:hypothetical protein
MIHIFAVTLTWSPMEMTGDEFVARDALSACVVGDKVLLFGGNNGLCLKTFQVLHLNWGSVVRQAKYDPKNVLHRESLVY